MNKTAGTITVIMFMSISLLGLFLMPYSGPGSSLSCLAAIVNNTASPCPQEDPLGFANFHNGALHKISSLILVDGVTALYAVSFLAFILFGALMTGSAGNRLVNPRAIYALELKTANHKFPIKLDWISLHEHSPSF